MRQLCSFIDDMYAHFDHSKLKCTYCEKDSKGGRMTCCGIPVCYDCHHENKYDYYQECGECHRNILYYYTNNYPESNCYKCQRSTQNRLDCCDKPLCYSCFISIKKRWADCKNCKKHPGYVSLVEK